LALTEVVAQADVITVLVKHREFMRSEVRAKLLELGALDFCGALA
jgi:uncharacterized membrane protein